MLCVITGHKQQKVDAKQGGVVAVGAIAISPGMARGALPAAAGFAAAPPIVKAVVAAVVAYVGYKIYKAKKEQDEKAAADKGKDNENGEPDGDDPDKPPPPYSRNKYSKPSEQARKDALSKDPDCPYCKNKIVRYGRPHALAKTRLERRRLEGYEGSS